MSGRGPNYDWGASHVFREVTLTDSDIARFGQFVREEGECWRWVGYINTTRRADGSYPRFRVKRRVYYAHRISYLIHRGEIPEGMQVDHLCRNKWCVRPEHLEPVTPRENMLRGNTLTAVIHRSGMCTRGHPLVPENLKVNQKNGKARCRQCRNEDARLRRKLKKQGAAA